MKTELTQIIKLCQNYKEYLFQNIITIIKNDTWAAIYYLSGRTSLDPDELIAEVLLDKPEIFEAQSKKEIRPWLKKYTLVDDILQPLLKDNLSVWQKKILFAEKFLQHENVFYYYRSVFHFFLPKTEEDRFIETAKLYTNQIKNKEVEKEQVQLHQSLLTRKN